MIASIDRRRLLTAGVFGAAGLATLHWPVAAMATTALPLADRLARYAEELSYADLDADTLEAVRIHLVDTFGCALGALDEPVVKAAFAVASAQTGGTATLIGSARRTSAELAAFANGAAIRFSDLNDGYAGKEIGHPSDLISACLAVAQVERRSIRDFIVSVVLAYEIECRLFDGAAISPRGWDHPTYTPVAAALAAGKLMRLPVAQLTQSVNLALISNVAMNQTRVQVISAWKGLADAGATRNGIFAATLARAGITGPSPIFEGDAGFEKMVAGTPMQVDTATFGRRGVRFRLLDCLIKPFPSQGHTLTAVAAAIELSREIPDKTLIRTVSVETSKPGYLITGKERDKWAPTTRETADHSMPYVVARALLDGEISSASYSLEKLSTPDVMALMAKISVVEDPAMTAKLPKQLANRVTVTLASGKTLTREIDDLPGSPQRPLTRADAEAKFWRAAGPAISRPQGARLLARLWTLETAPDVDSVMAAAQRDGRRD
ncbi:MmgE/PrpD family protein [Sphingomonas sp. PAMC26645]|uniref:MmgE/PrpD family protein n=1 Tax=Sphingomonas sp. PAMC26645 TaxID=2565555 RepID=UPI00109D8916|nr:MmgE/PrpD family protein [Sphingomonas sp. PAMC26645]QCB43269.1 MmgE/PrpD family protein [Sphingomonas sp. PAMC26645]